MRAVLLVASTLLLLDSVTVGLRYVLCKSEVIAGC